MSRISAAECTAGVDEAGRGALAGPVCAAAVILDARRPIAGLDDSKRLSPARRAALAVQIRSQALACSVAWATVAEIEQLNVLGASLLAMARAVHALAVRPRHVLVDGPHAPQLELPVTAVVGGDRCMAAISAASILAKVERDQHMVALSRQYPRYNFATHKGYGTRMHLQALQRYGASQVHRRSYAPVRQALAAHRGEGTSA